MNVLGRRDFLHTSLVASGGLLVPSRLDAAAHYKTRLHKAKIVGEVTEAALKPLKDAGFEGVETTALVAPEEAAKGRAIAKKLGMRVHSVLRGWAEFNSPDAKKVEDSLALTEKALRAAHGYGADAVLTVPCRVGGIEMPKAWDFKVAFDAQTGHVTSVVEGDNAPYRAYIDAQNHATDTSRAAVQKLIPVAKEVKVVIALENVWNNLWVTPALFQSFVASFKSPWVKAYFDVGNHVKYPAPVQDWIRALGPLLAKVHIKDYQLHPDHKEEKFVHPRDGSVNWPAVRQAFEDIRYNGWLTIEDGGLPLEEFNRRIDLIIAGQ